MRYGYFDDENREYVITTPRTPLPWINYLGSEDFFSLVSNTAGGYSFYRDAKLLRLTRYRYNSAPADGEGHRFYIRDGACVWNPGWQPVRTELDSYRCRHGLGYTVIEGAKNGIEAKQEMFVPLGDACEVIRLTLHNAGAEPRALQLFSYVEFCLWTVSYTHLRAHETRHDLVCRLLLEKKKKRMRCYAVFWLAKQRLYERMPFRSHTRVIITSASA